MASPQPRHGELRSRLYKHRHGCWPKLRWASCTCYSISYVPKEIFGLLSQAVRRYLTTKPCNSSRALQTNHRWITGCRRLGFRWVSPLLHHFYTFCTRQSTLIDGGCQCSPKETSSMPQQRCALSLRVCLLVLTLFPSPQNDSVSVPSLFNHLMPVAMTPTVQTCSNASKRSRTSSIINKTSKQVKKTTSSARYALDPFWPSRHAFPSHFSHCTYHYYCVYRHSACYLV